MSVCAVVQEGIRLVNTTLTSRRKWAGTSCTKSQILGVLAHAYTNLNCDGTSCTVEAGQQEWHSVRSRMPPLTTQEKCHQVQPASNRHCQLPQFHKIYRWPHCQTILTPVIQTDTSYMTNIYATDIQFIVTVSAGTNVYSQTILELSVRYIYRWRNASILADCVGLY